MANFLKWAAVYKFDDDADSYVLTPFDEETDQEQSQSEDQMTISAECAFSEFDDSEEDDNPS